MEDRKVKCTACYFYKFVNIGGEMYPWCFNDDSKGLVADINKAKECLCFKTIPFNFNLTPDQLSRNQREQRNGKIKRRCKLYRFSYSIEEGITSIISRFSHWVLILSDNKEYLFHQNMDIFKTNEYHSMFLIDKPEFHLHYVVDNSSMAIHKIFENIESHDVYVVKNRYYKTMNGQF